MPFIKAALKPTWRSLNVVAPRAPQPCFHVQNLAVAHAARMRQERWFFAASTKPPPAHHSSQCYELYRKKGGSARHVLCTPELTSEFTVASLPAQAPSHDLGGWRCKQVWEEQHIPDTAWKVELFQLGGTPAKAAPKKTGTPVAASSARAGNTACVLRANSADIKPSVPPRGALSGILFYHYKWRKIWEILFNMPMPLKQ